MIFDLPCLSTYVISPSGPANIAKKASFIFKNVEVRVGKLDDHSKVVGVFSVDLSINDFVSSICFCSFKMPY